MKSVKTFKDYIWNYNRQFCSIHSIFKQFLKSKLWDTIVAVKISCCSRNSSYYDHMSFCARSEYVISNVNLKKHWLDNSLYRIRFSVLNFVLVIYFYDLLTFIWFYYCKGYDHYLCDWYTLCKTLFVSIL